MACRACRTFNMRCARAGKEPLVHLWSDEKNLTRRVIRSEGASCGQDRARSISLRQVQNPAGSNFCGRIRRRQSVAFRASNFEHASTACLPRRFLMQTLNRYQRRRIWSIHSRACMFAGACARGQASGLFWLRRPPKMLRPSTGCLHFGLSVAGLDTGPLEKASHRSIAIVCS